MTALYIQAKNNQLQNTQYTDIETIIWAREIIEKNAITLVDSKLIEIIGLVEMSKYNTYLPKSDCFIDPKKYYSIHGISHISRVLFYYVVICEFTGVKVKDSLLFAASHHDIGRISDKNDLKHGERAVETLKQSNKKIYDALKKEGRYSIMYHDVPWSKIPCDVIDSYHDDIQLIKLADALDRYRLPKEKWWPNDSFLTSEIILSKHVFSYLTNYSEEYFINSKNAVDSINKAVNRLSAFLS